MSTQYVVVYRIGGRVNFRWLRSLSHSTYESARDSAVSTARMGYEAYVVDMGLSYAIGLPDTFDYSKP